MVCSGFLSLYIYIYIIPSCSYILQFCALICFSICITRSNTGLENEKPNGYDVFNATTNYLATVSVAVPPPQDNGEYHICSFLFLPFSILLISPNSSFTHLIYVVDVENLTQEIHSKDKEIERLSAEKEEFSVFLIRDLLASQKLTEELKKEVEFLKKQLSESYSKHP